MNGLMRIALLLVAVTVAGAAGAVDARVWQEPVTGMRFVEIPKGCYRMGSDVPQEPQPDYYWERVNYKKDISQDERPAHEVCLDTFWIGTHEVTAEAWQKIMGVPAASRKQQPAVGVDSAQAEAFAEKLTARSGGAQRYRLPTEAEWEYACRAGGGKDVVPLEDGAEGQAWYRTRKSAVQPVGLLAANGLGLFDMLGNAWEWVADSYLPDAYARHTLYNPRVTAGPGGASPQRVIRGGSVRTENVQTRCTMRGHVPPDYHSDVTGFRLVRDK
jgi:formylglycine-generating enzyme required for sulfatase activity